MRLWRKGLTVMLGAGMLAALFAGTTWAAEDREKITNVSLTVSSSIEAGGDNSNVNVTSNDKAGYEVTEIFVVNDEGEWLSGDVPRVEVTLEADDGYYFASMGKSKVSLKGDDATYVTSHRSEKNSVLTITIKLDALEGTLEIEGVEWEGDQSPIAVWEPTDGAKSYQIRLYRESSSVGSAITTTSDRYDFSSSITRVGDYYFKVRAINSNNKRGDWYESDSLYVDEEKLAYIKSGSYNNGNSTSPNTPTPTQGTWQQDNVGWWYRNANGTYPANCWQQINGLWYFFNPTGYMHTGWVQSGGKWYYCDTTPGNNLGAMLVNTITPDGNRVDANGVWIQ